VDDAEVFALAQHSGTQRPKELKIVSWNFDTKNIAQNINFLETFNKDVAKILKKEIKAGANEVAKASRRRIPKAGLSNWGAWTYSRDGRDLGFIGGWVKRGIVVETTRTRNRGATVAYGQRVVTKTPAGAIFELAGSKSKSPMALAVKAEHPFPVKTYPRTLFPAYYEAMPTALKKIEAAVEKAKKVGG
jgi:hypothetical protein